MKYRGFVLQPEYFIGSDYRVLADGRVVDRKPTRKDIEYYEILDPMENMDRHGAENTIAECKSRIDALLKVCGMESNSKECWDKIGGYPIRIIERQQIDD